MHCTTVVQSELRTHTAIQSEAKIRHVQSKDEEGQSHDFNTPVSKTEHFFKRLFILESLFIC